MPWAARSQAAGPTVKRRPGREGGGKAALKDARQSAKNRQANATTTLAAALLALFGSDLQPSIRNHGQRTAYLHGNQIDSVLHGSATWLVEECAFSFVRVRQLNEPFLDGKFHVFRKVHHRESHKDAGVANLDGPSCRC